MSGPQPIEAKHPERRAAFWITLARSVLALETAGGEQRMLFKNGGAVPK